MGALVAVSFFSLQGVEVGTACRRLLTTVVSRSEKGPDTELRSQMFHRTWANSSRELYEPEQSMLVEVRFLVEGRQDLSLTRRRLNCRMRATIHILKQDTLAHLYLPMATYQ